jgi:hypothetical protein
MFTLPVILSSPMKSGRLLFLLVLVPVLAHAAPSLDTLEPRPRDLLQASLHYADGYWDESAGLLRSPVPGESGRHRTRESTWYALGLFIRNQPGDEARAVRIIERVLAYQLTAPGQRWDGTFRRFLDEPAPGPGAELWKDFDPNWRHFIGTTLALILTEFEPRLPAGLPARLEDAIRRAVEGELTQGRDEPYHTNIKLMHGFLWSWAGVRLGRPEWIAGGERWAEEVSAAFAVHETFEEYNSPTYYGVDFYGLALMRRHGATERIRALGAQLEAGLWRDVARFYHAGLRNMAGPYDRAYGMDMRRYASLTGVWMGLVLPAELTPLPDPAGPMGHAHDFLCTPTYVALGARVPADVREHFTAFRGERLLRRPITATRTATAWLAPDVMIGGELTGHRLGVVPGIGQFHPATIHWRTPENEVGWVRLFATPPADAEAAPGRLTITAAAAGDFTFQVSAPGAVAGRLSRDAWHLPGLSLTVETDAKECSIEAEKGVWVVHYRGASRLAFRVVPRLAVVIAVDQMRADYLERFRPWFVEGGFKRLLEGGAVYADAHHRHAMTATAPGHATLVTGVHADVHGIIANEWFDPAAGRVTSSVADPASPLVGAAATGVRLPGGVGDTDPPASPARLLAATVGDQLKAAWGDDSRIIGLANKERGGIFLSGRHADAVYWPHLGRIVTARHYREALPAWVEAFNAEDPINIRFGQTWDRLLPQEPYEQVQGPDDVPGEESRHGLGTTFPRRIDGGRPALDGEFHNAYRLDPHGTEMLGRLAQRAVTAEQLGRRAAPDLLCLAFSQLDYCGHSFGPDSHEIMDSVLRLDRVLAGLFAHLDAEVGAGRWTVVLSADHGVAPLPERSGGNRLDWPALNRSVEAALSAAFGAPAAEAAWTFRDGHGYRLIPAALAARGVTAPAARQVVKTALLAASQVAVAWTRDELLDPNLIEGEALAGWRLSFNADRGPDVVLSPRRFVADRAPAGTNHGTPHDYDTHIPLLWYGAGIAPGVHIERIGSDAVAPTLARLLGVPAPPAARAAPLF